MKAGTISAVWNILDSLSVTGSRTQSSVTGSYWYIKSFPPPTIMKVPSNWTLEAWLMALGRGAPRVHSEVPKLYRVVHLVECTFAKYAFLVPGC